MKKTNKPNPLKVFNDSNAKARMKAGGAMKEFKKSLSKAQKGISNVDTINKLMVDKTNVNNSKSNERAKAQTDLLDKKQMLNQTRKKNIEQARQIKKGPALENYGTDPYKQKKGGPVKKKMAAGGSSDSDCWPGKPGCGAEKARRVNKRRRFWNSDTGKTIKKVGAGVGVAGAGVAAYAKNLFGVKDAVKGLGQQKKGGAVKRKK